jgi:TetR/AcrR family transcriptional repressor of nem operon
LDVAERMVQTRGFNGFSYADVAAELRLSKATLHYHFAGKAELGEALLVRYTQRFAAALDAIDSEPLDAPGKLIAYANLYLDVLRQDRMCLCGMIAAEYQTLPEPMQAIVVQFFLDNETWLSRVLEKGLAEGSIRVTGTSRDTARTVVANLEGAMLVARPFHDIDRFRTVASATITALQPTA